MYPLVLVLEVFGNPKGESIYSSDIIYVSIKRSDPHTWTPETRTLLSNGTHSAWRTTCSLMHSMTEGPETTTGQYIYIPAQPYSYHPSNIL